MSYSRSRTLRHVPVLNSRLLVHAIAFCVCFLSHAYACEAIPASFDVVTFLNGDQLSGHLMSANKDAVSFKGTVTGDLLLNWSDIAQIKFASSTVSFVNAQHPDGIKIASPVITVMKSDICISSKTESFQPFPINQLVSASVSEALSTAKPSEISKPEPYFEAVGGTLKVSPESIVRATQKQISFAGAFDMGLVTKSEEPLKHQETNIGLEANYTDSRKPGGAAVITELYSGLVQNKFYITRTRHVCENCANVAKDGPYLYVIANAYHNLSLGMRVAQSYGGGIGWDGSHGRSSYTLAADIRYLSEDLYAPGKSLSSGAAGLQEAYFYMFPWPKPESGLTFSESILLLPAFNDSKAFLVRGTSTLDIPFSQKLSFDITLLDDYLRNAPPKSLQNYLKLVFSLKYIIGTQKTAK